MSRILLTNVLDDRARELASHWLMASSRRSQTVEGLYLSGPEFVLQELYKYTYKDEHEHIAAALRKNLGGDRLKDFNDAAAKKFSPRDDKVFAKLLADKLAIDPDGKHISGKIGSTQVGGRVVGTQYITVEHPYSIRTRRMMGVGKDWEGRHLIKKMAPLVWPVYAGEDDERAAESGVADPFPPLSMIGAAADFTISNEAALAALDAVVDRLDEGTGAAVIQGRTGAKPADVDTAVTGVLLFTCVMTDPAFGAAADAAPGAIATASAIADDTAADATNTLGYCRVSATNDGATPLDDHMDLNADTSGGDANFNTLSIVSGGTVSITSFTASLAEQA